MGVLMRLELPVDFIDIKDWVRKAADRVNPLIRGYPFPTLDSEPSDVLAGYTYFDDTLKKVRTYDGTIWQDLF